MNGGQTGWGWRPARSRPPAPLRFNEARHGGRDGGQAAGRLRARPRSFNEARHGADAGWALVGVEPGEDPQDAAGPEVGHPLVDGRLSDEQGQQEQAEHDDRVPGVTSSGAGRVARLQDRAGGFEVERPQDQRLGPVSLELLLEVGDLGVHSAGIDDGLAVGFVAGGWHRLLLRDVQRRRRSVRRATGVIPPLPVRPVHADRSLPTPGLVAGAPARVRSRARPAFRANADSSDVRGSAALSGGRNCSPTRNGLQPQRGLFS